MHLIQGQYGRGGSYESESGRSTSSSSSSNTNNIFGAARGPGDYHGTMSKDEIEREAGGAIFTSNNEETRNQVENTRYRGSGQTTSSRVASGATETRLTDGDRQQGGIGPGMESSNDQLYGANSGYRSSYDYEKTFQSGSSSSSPSRVIDVTSHLSLG